MTSETKRSLNLGTLLRKRLKAPQATLQLRQGGRRLLQAVTQQLCALHLAGRLPKLPQQDLTERLRPSNAIRLIAIQDEKLLFTWPRDPRVSIPVCKLEAYSKPALSL